jgi:hypothetical protein
MLTEQGLRQRHTLLTNTQGGLFIVRFVVLVAQSEGGASQWALRIRVGEIILERFQGVLDATISDASFL